MNSIKNADSEYIFMIQYIIWKMAEILLFFGLPMMQDQNFFLVYYMISGYR